MSIYVQQGETRLGPLTEEQLKEQLSLGAISPQDMVWWDGQADWIMLSQSPFAGTLPGLAAAPAIPAAPPIAGAVPATTSKLAVWALVCGCLGFFLSVFASIPAIVLGHMGMNEIRRNPAKTGYGMALAGTILGYVLTFLLPLISIVAISVLIALGNQVKSTFKTIDAQTNGMTQPAPSGGTNSAPGQ